MDTVCIIPARMSSTRLPGKPLLEKNGVTLIETVWRACKDTGFDVIVATDHGDIFDKVKSFGGYSVMTDSDIPTGTDRCAEVVIDEQHIKVVNVQGDMPYINPQQIIDCASLLNQYDVGTLIYEMSPEEQNNPNSVKCIAVESDHDDFNCKWFGRMSIPYGYHHAGIYSYRHYILKQYPNLKLGKHEKQEKLEQLRWLENDYEIHALKTTPIQGEINTPEDYKNWCG